jgi:elongation factor 1-gamma
MKLLIAAAMNGLEVPVAPNFVMGKTNKTPEYLAKFPLGKIPSFESANGYCLTESNAIGYYLCESGPKKDQLLGATAEEHGLVHQWVNFNSEHLLRTVRGLATPVLGFAPYNADVEAQHLEEIRQWMTYLEGQLTGRTWLLPGERAGPSYADLSIAQSLRFGFKYYLDAEFRKDYPRVMEWWNRLLAIPEVEKAFGENVLVDKKPTHSSK